MSQPSILSKQLRVMRTFKVPIILAIIGGVVCYIRSQPIPIGRHAVGTGSVVRSVMGKGTLDLLGDAIQHRAESTAWCAPVSVEIDNYRHRRL